MLDVVRAAIVLVALAQAIRHRFWLGAFFAVVLTVAFTLVAGATWSALARHLISGEYGFAFVYIGPTILPFGGRIWMPAAVQVAIVALSGVPAVAVLRVPASPVATPFLSVFVPSAMLAIVTGLTTFLLWRQQVSFPEYWAP